MSDIANASPIAPTAVPPSVVSSFYESKEAVNTARRGPLRFEEGLGTDPALGPEFMRGVQQGMPAPGSMNHNANVYEKSAQETTQERLHPGSAAWVEAPTYLGAFADGTSPEAEQKYIMTDRSGGRYERRNAAQVTD